MPGGSPDFATVDKPFYTGAEVSPLFTNRWMSQLHVGAAKPWMQVRIRRGKMERGWHDNWPSPQFGQVVGDAITHQWYATWKPHSDWTVLDTVQQVGLDQSFDNNGSTLATIVADNVEWLPKTDGPSGDLYHSKERGYLWPWRGYTPPLSPGASGNNQNEWYRQLPNAQIEVKQGYGQDTAIKTFTGLIDTCVGGNTPDIMTISARDFGGILADCNLFGWNKTRNIPDPISFVPRGYNPKAVNTTGRKMRWIVIDDVTDIVRCVLRWAGFKEWQIENSGVNLSEVYTVDKSKSYMDVITDIATQLGYVFFIGEPDNDNDLSIGIPVFRPSQAMRLSSPALDQANLVALHGHRLLTNFVPTHDNSSDRYIIRVRGQLLSRAKGGVTLYGDKSLRATWQYWPPWTNWMAGIIKQLTYYNAGDASTLGFTTVEQCRIAAVLIAMQIALLRDTATGTTLGNPNIGLDSFTYATDESNGIASRWYITNRTSTMKIGGEGSGPVGGGNAQTAQDPIWSVDLGGSLTDNPEWLRLRLDYAVAKNGGELAAWANIDP